MTAKRDLAPVWRVAGIVCALALYGVSVSGRAYNATSPATLAHHEIYRKAYAILAFALLGFLFECSRLRARGVLAGGIAIAAYSYAIELGQIFFKQSSETFAEHSFDVASGLAGGALGVFVALLLAARTARERRGEAIAIAVAFALLAWGFSATYGRLD